MVDDFKKQLTVDNEAVQELVVAKLASRLDRLDSAGIADNEGSYVLVCALSLAVNHGDSGTTGCMGINDLVEIDVEHHVASAHNDIGLVGTLEEHLVGNDVAKQEAHATARRTIRVAGNQEQATLLAVEHPVFTGADVVDKRTVVSRHHDANGLDAGVHHIGERKIDEAITSNKRQRCKRTILKKNALLPAGVISGDIADGLTVDHRFIPPSRSRRRFR